MNLRSGTPVWLQGEVEGRAFPALRKNARCDVLIVGAGITGALVAHGLSKTGLKVVVLEKRRIGKGSTAASTGLLLYQTDTSFADLSRMHSRKTAERVFQLGRKAIREIGNIAREIGAQQGYRARSSLYVAKKPKDRAVLKREAKAEERSGFPNTYLNSADLENAFRLRRPGAILASGSAEANALELTRAIFRRHRGHARLRVFENSRVKRIVEEKHRCKVVLANGTHVTAKHVIVAAGYEAGTFFESHLVRLHSTYVIASQPFPPSRLWPGGCVMWETDRPYFYLRTTPDHRIIFGGRDEPYSDPQRRDRKLRSKTRQLEKDFAKLYPDLAFTAEFSWTGTFAETVDGLPCIGPRGKNSRIYYALGYGGNGITFSQIASDILCDLCQGINNKDSSLFRFDRTVGSDSAG